MQARANDREPLKFCEHVIRVELKCYISKVFYALHMFSVKTKTIIGVGGKIRSKKSALIKIGFQNSRHGTFMVSLSYVLVLLIWEHIFTKQQHFDHAKSLYRG